MPITRDPYSRTITASDGQLYPICLTKLTADPILVSHHKATNITSGSPSKGLYGKRVLRWPRSFYVLPVVQAIPCSTIANKKPINSETAEVHLLLNTGAKEFSASLLD
jgi:hypothetical protein